MPWLHYPWGKSPQYPLGGPQSRSGYCGEKENFAHCGNRTLAVQPVAHRYACRAILDACNCEVIIRNFLFMINASRALCLFYYDLHILFILWHVRWKPELWSQQRKPLLGNGSANTSIARLQRPKQTPVARQWLNERHVTMATLMYATIKKLLAVVLSVWSVPRLYNQGQLKILAVITVIIGVCGSVRLL
jgi:hypothetical protein